MTRLRLTALCLCLCGTLALGACGGSGHPDLDAWMKDQGKTAKGKLRGRRANSSHILEKKSPARKRRFRRPSEISGADRGRVKKLLVKAGR